MNYSAFSQESNISSDRFIPLRKELNWQIKMNLSEEDITSQQELETPKSPASSGLEEKQVLYKSLLKNELIGTKIFDLKLNNGSFKGVSSSSSNLFTYSNVQHSTPTKTSVSNFIYSPPSQKLLRFNCISDQYKIPPHPYKILDAPDLVDDFYLNLLDWSSTNCICIALKSCIYIWSCETEEVVYLCNVEPEIVTSVSFQENGTTLAFATDHGRIHIWNLETKTEVRLLRGYSVPQRINALSWNGNMLMSGGSSKTIVKHDITNSSNKPIQKLVGHYEDVCGLKLSSNKQYLASGGNDNFLCIWDNRMTHFIHKFVSHTSAVKALAWSPHQSSILASGGGSQDRTIRIWNVQSGKELHTINTGSQVCNLTWSKFSNDFLSTHGVPSNDINVWNYSRLKCVANLTGHTTRVLYLAASPHGNNVATAGGEELRLWKVFNAHKLRNVKKSALELFGSIR